MSNPIAKVSRENLAAFLHAHGNSWRVDAFPEFENLVIRQPMTAGDLMYCLARYWSVPDEPVYVFHCANAEVVRGSGPGPAGPPTVDAAGLEQFIGSRIPAQEFLRTAANEYDVADGKQITIVMPNPGEEDVEKWRSTPSPSLISRISIAGFKGIGEEVTIDVKPITLIFGANSTGKSTILHALHYAREIFERHNLDADRTIAGGEFVDLGGFPSFVHAHNQHSSIVLRFDLDLRGRSLPEYLPNRVDLLQANAALPNDPVGVDSASVTVSISWKAAWERLMVEKYSVDINGRWLGEIVGDMGSSGSRVRITRLNTKHPIFEPGYWGEFVSEHDWSWMDYWSDAVFGTPEDGPHPIVISNQADALPNWGTFLALELPTLTLGPGNAEHVDRPNHQSMDHPESDQSGQLVLLGTLSQLFVGPGELLRDALCGMRYLGPLRQIPPRHHQPPRFPDPARWANGLAAWDAILENDGLLAQCNTWLEQPERLNTGYRVVNRQFRELTPEIQENLEATISTAFDHGVDFLLDAFSAACDNLQLSQRLAVEVCRSLIELQPQDLGVGIAQLVPVVVACVAKTGALSLIEQPELHLHPAVQVRLAELFIDRAHRGFGPLILETHSEHLILRLVRRIRETHEKNLPAGHLGLTPDLVAVIYIEKENGQVRANQLRIDETGEFRDRWPKGFFEERAEELF